MKKQLEHITWLNKTYSDDKLQNSNNDKQVRVIINDDIPNPSDFRLSPEEYKRIYKERLENEKTMSTNPKEYTNVYTEHKTINIFSIAWLNESLETNPQQEINDPIVIIQKHPAKTFEMDPEEYRQTKEELEEERKRVYGYYNSPEHFYNEESYNIVKK